MTFVYPAVVSPKENGNGYHVMFPDLACCEAEGPDLEDALENASDAAYNWILAELEEEEDCDIPAASDHEELKLQEGEFIRNIMVRIKLLPDND